MEHRCETHPHDVLLQKWLDNSISVYDEIEKLDSILMSSPDSPLKQAIWEMHAGYTKAVSKIIGDKDEWLNWFAWECDFGRDPKVIAFSDGETLVVCGIADLLDAIKSNDNGTRNYNWANDSAHATNTERDHE